jgi:carboxypeptidase Q
MRTRPTALALLLAVLAPALPAPAQTIAERVDLAVVERIRDEGLNRSGLEPLAWYLTDVIGPRLTGSTGMRRANEWTAEMFRSWGLANVRVEPWGEFGRGWERVSYYGRMLEPFVQPLHATPLAWTGSTPGRVDGPVIAIEAETPDELVARYRGRLGGAFVLAQAPVPIGPEFEPFTRRFDAATLLEPPSAAPAGPPPAAARAMQMVQRAQAFNQVLDSMMRAEGAHALLRPSQWAYGILRVGGGGSRSPQDPEAMPALVVSHDHYGQMWRNVTRGVPVRIELDVQNRFLTDDLLGYNTLADLPGGDLADEYVMIGAHLDSWHSGTGATDNAAGSVVMMEAMRILKTLGLQPRRTIRVALWSGEEQGLLGSRFWVQNNEPLWPRISAYLNIDNGTGRVRGIWNQSNEAVTGIFEQILWPFRDLGVVAVRHGNTGGTDHLAFDRVGIPGFNFIQDPIEYSLRTHHSNVDTYDRLVLDDLRQAAVVVAATAWHLAMRDEPLPRKPATSDR